jgi:hypothetical protein
MSVTLTSAHGTTKAGKRGLPVGGWKWIVSAAGGLLAAVPSSITMLVLVSCLLTVTDTLTGIWLAGRERQVRSRTMREMLGSKAFQFVNIGALGIGGAAIAQNWIPAGLAIGMVCAIESTSIVENLTRLERTGGTDLGPFKPVIAKLASFMNVADANEPNEPREPKEGHNERH